MEEELICNTCGWVGDLTMLVSSSDRLDDPCDKCPECGSNDIEDFE